MFGIPNLIELCSAPNRFVKQVRNRSVWWYYFGFESNNLGENSAFTPGRQDPRTAKAKKAQP